MSKVREQVKGQTFYRDFLVMRNAINKESRTVNLAFSSSEPYQRWFGNEILDHTPKSVRLNRLKDGGAVLVNHDTGDQVGVVETATVNGSMGRATVRFGNSPRADEIFNDIVDGIRSKVSVGYIVHEMVLEKTGDIGADTYRVTDWEPLEVSIVSVPADTTVGVGRSHSNSRGNVSMDSNNQPGITGIDGNQKTNDARDIAAFGEMYPQLKDIAIKHIRDGKSLEEFRALALKELHHTKPLDTNNPSSQLGMSERELGQYSLRKLILAQLDPRRYGKEAGLELAASDEHARMTGREPRGIYVPHDVLVRTTLTVGTAAQGGNLVGTDHLAQNFVELLRNASVVGQLGAMQLDGLVGNVSIPTQTGASDPYWIAEGGTITAESTPNFGSIPLTPKTVASYVSASRKLMLQSSPQIEQLLRNDLALTIATEIDRVAINGSGAGAEPTGILNTSGIGDVAGGTNGAAPTWANIVALESDLATANADVGALAYLTNAAARAKLKTTLKNPTYGDEYIWETNPLEAPVGVINSNKAAVSNNVPSNLTKGTGTNLSAIIFGNFSDLIIGMWGGLDLKVDEVTLGSSGGLVIRVFQDIDIGVRHAGSFSAMQDAITA